jgi:hypothetical protein
VPLLGRKQGASGCVGHRIVCEGVGREGRLFLRGPEGPILVHIDVRGRHDLEEKTCWTSGERWEGGPRGNGVDASSIWRRRAVSFAACWSLVWSFCWVISEYLMWEVLMVTVARGREGCCGG